MNRKEILVIVYDYVQQNSLLADFPEEVTEEDNISSFGLDSIAILSLAMSIEIELNISIPDSEIELWSTFGDIINSIEKQQ